MRGGRSAVRDADLRESRLSGSRHFASNRQSPLARLWIRNVDLQECVSLGLRSPTRDPVTREVERATIAARAGPLASHCILILAGLGFEFLTKLLPQSTGYRAQVSGERKPPLFNRFLCEFLELLRDRLRGFFTL